MGHLGDSTVSQNQTWFSDHLKWGTYKNAVSLVSGLDVMSQMLEQREMS